MQTTPSFRLNDAPLHLLSDHFIDRQKEMDQILSSLDMLYGDIPTRCVVYGDHGVGKTQLAIKLAASTMPQRRYPCIFWIPASTIEGLRESFTQLLHSVHHPARAHPDEDTRLTEAQRWLEDVASGQWLLILDNVTRQAVAFLREHLPRRNKDGQILFTTLMEHVALALAHVSGEKHSTIRLCMPDVEDAAHLLLEHFTNATLTWMQARPGRS